MIAFDDALVLLDRDILFMLLLHGHTFDEETRPVLNLGALLYPKEPLVQDSLGRYIKPSENQRKRADDGNFEVLKLSH